MAAAPVVLAAVSGQVPEPGCAAAGDFRALADAGGAAAANSGGAAAPAAVAGAAGAPAPEYLRKSDHRWGLERLRTMGPRTFTTKPRAPGGLSSTAFSIASETLGSGPRPRAEILEPKACLTEIFAFPVEAPEAPAAAAAAPPCPLGARERPPRALWATSDERAAEDEKVMRRFKQVAAEAVGFGVRALTDSAQMRSTLLGIGVELPAVHVAEVESTAHRCGVRSWAQGLRFTRACGG